MNYVEPHEKLSLVNHPQHYQGKGIEVIDIIEAFDLNFSLGNSIKYILRANKKGNKKQDLEKAIWYLNNELNKFCLLYTSPSPRDGLLSRMPSSA